MKKLYIFIACSFLLSACTVGHEDFDCPNNGKGYGCKGLKEVYGLVTEQHNEKVMTPVMDTVPAKNIDHTTVASADSSIIQRTQEEKLRLWIAPFQDEQGNFHEPSVIHTVIRPSYWQMNTINWE